MRLAVPCKLRVLTALLKDIFQFRQFNHILIIYGDINISKFLLNFLMLYAILYYQNYIYIGGGSIHGRRP